MAQDPELVIMDGAGREHVFPPGFDPQKAAGIVRAQGAGTETSDPNEAWWNSIKKQSGQLVTGAVNSLPAIGGLVGGALSTPESLGVATVPGMAVGAGVGRGARDLLAEWLQLEKKTSPLTKAATIALEIGTTAAAAKVLPVIADAVQNPKAVLGEVISRNAHPLKTMDELATALKASRAAKPTPMAAFPEHMVDLERFGGSSSGYVAGEAASTASEALPGLSGPQATYVKLPDGTFGLQGPGLQEGDVVNVMTRGGHAVMKTVGKILDTTNGVTRATVGG